MGSVFRVLCSALGVKSILQKKFKEFGAFRVLCSALWIKSILQNKFISLKSLRV